MLDLIGWKKLKKWQKILLICTSPIWIVLWLSMFGIGIFVLIGVFGWIFPRACVETTTNIKDYGAFFKEWEDFYEIFPAVFPENLEKVQRVNSYIYSGDSFYANEYQIFLDVTYDKETFEKEKKYWAEYVYYFQEEPKNKPKFDDAYLFAHPTYVFYYNYYKNHDSHEYIYISIIEEENRMIYVGVRNTEKKHMLIDDEFLPKNYYKNLTSEDDDYVFAVQFSENTWYD